MQMWCVADKTLPKASKWMQPADIPVGFFHLPLWRDPACPLRSNAVKQLCVDRGKDDLGEQNWPTGWNRRKNFLVFRKLLLVSNSEHEKKIKVKGIVDKLQRRGWR